eukprot:6624160-Prymnesium_polylepis.1
MGWCGGTRCERNIEEIYKRNDPLFCKKRVPPPTGDLPLVVLEALPAHPVLAGVPARPPAGLPHIHDGGEWRIQPSRRPRSERSTTSTSSGNPSSLRSWRVRPPPSCSACAPPAS